MSPQNCIVEHRVERHWEMVWGKYHGTTMEANKRDWNSVGKSSNLLQVREPGVLGLYPLQTSVASLATD